MTNQEIFDTVVAHMRTQKYSCVEDGLCRYYDPETGRKCAVGCLIPEDMYDVRMDLADEDTGILTNSLVLSALERIGVGLESSVDLLVSMQTIHDWMCDLEWGEYQEKQCKHVASRYNLNYTAA